MIQKSDTVAVYGDALGWTLRPRTILVEGTRDVEYFQLAARLEFEKSGLELVGEDLAIIAAGEKENGGTRGVCRELIRLQGYARTSLLPNGRTRYRFIGLFDNDKAGREAVKGIRNFDASILEYKDVFRLRPSMPCSGNLDPKTLEKTFERLNANYKGLIWEIEDLLADDFVEAFMVEYPNATLKTDIMGDKVHREFSIDGKAHLYRYVMDNAMLEDLLGIVDVIRALRFYLHLPKAGKLASGSR